MLYDLIIIGSGPAGLTASIYASRYKLSNLVIGKLLGGTITYAHKVENFPGSLGISGVELSQKIAEQVKSLGAEILAENVVDIKSVACREISSPQFSARTCTETKNNSSALASADSKISASSLGSFTVKTESGKEYEAKSLIISTGTERRKLNVPGEKEYLGKGVSYCVTCDAPFFKGKTVVLVGGSNAACSGALHLASLANKVYLIYRRSELRAEPVWVEEIKENPKIEVIYNMNVVKILGGLGGQEGTGGPASVPPLGGLRQGKQGKVAAVELDTPYNGEKILKTDGVFIEIGGVPATDFIKPLGVATDEEGYIRVNEKMETNIAGIFAAGDITDKSKILSQVITACAQGAIAANSAFAYLKSSS